MWNCIGNGLSLQLELEKTTFLSTLTFWEYRYGEKKKLRKLNKFEIPTKLRKSMVWTFI